MATESTVLAAYLRARPRAPPFDPRHRRCTDACRHWHSHKLKASVCIATRVVHLCGPQCTLEGREGGDGDSTVCPITNIVQDRQVYTQAPTFDKNSRPLFHWAPAEKIRTAKTTRRAKKRTVSSVAKVAAVTRQCFAVSCSARAPAVANAARKLGKRTSFHDVAACVHGANLPRTLCKQAKERALVAIAKDVQSYLERHAPMRGGTIDVRVAVILTLLTTGWVVGGVTIFPRVPFVANHLPSPGLMSAIPRITCRPISVGVRGVKRFALTEEGLPLVSRVLTLSRKTHELIYTAETTARPV